MGPIQPAGGLLCPGCGPYPCFGAARRPAGEVRFCRVAHHGHVAGTGGLAAGLGTASRSRSTALSAASFLRGASSLDAFVSTVGSVEQLWLALRASRTDRQATHDEPGQQGHATTRKPIQLDCSVLAAWARVLWPHATHRRMQCSAEATKLRTHTCSAALQRCTSLTERSPRTPTARPLDARFPLEQQQPLGERRSHGERSAHARHATPCGLRNAAAWEPAGGAGRRAQLRLQPARKRRDVVGHWCRRQPEGLYSARQRHRRGALFRAQAGVQACRSAHVGGSSRASRRPGREGGRAVVEGSSLAAPWGGTAPPTRTRMCAGRPGRNSLWRRWACAGRRWMLGQPPTQPVLQRQASSRPR